MWLPENGARDSGGSPAILRYTHTFPVCTVTGLAAAGGDTGLAKDRPSAHCGRPEEAALSQLRAARHVSSGDATQACGIGRAKSAAGSRPSPAARLLRQKGQRPRNRTGPASGCCGTSQHAPLCRWACSRCHPSSMNPVRRGKGERGHKRGLSLLAPINLFPLLSQTYGAAHTHTLLSIPVTRKLPESNF